MKLHFEFIRGEGLRVFSDDFDARKVHAIRVISKVGGKDIICPCLTYEMDGKTLDVNAPSIPKRRKVKSTDSAYFMMEGGNWLSLWLKAEVLGNQFEGPALRKINEGENHLPWIQSEFSLAGAENSIVAAAFGQVTTPYVAAYEQAIQDVKEAKTVEEFDKKTAIARKALEAKIACRKAIDEYTVEDFLTDKPVFAEQEVSG